MISIGPGTSSCVVLEHTATRTKRHERSALGITTKCGGCCLQRDGHNPLETAAHQGATAVRDARATQTPSPLSARVAPLARTGAQGLLTIARFSAASDRERGTASKRSLGRWAQEESERDR